MIISVDFKHKEKMMAAAQRSFSGINPGAGANTAKPGSGYNEIRRTSAQDRTQGNNAMSSGPTPISRGAPKDAGKDPRLTSEFQKKSLLERYVTVLAHEIRSQGELEYSF